MRKISYLLLIILIIFSISNIVLAADIQEQALVTSITSNSYIISKEKKLISRILPKTTIEAIKQEFNVKNSTVHIWDSNGKEEIKQGYIGTGMQIKFDNHETTYIASIIGDTNGDGEIGQFEVSKAIKHVIGLEKHQLTGVNAVSIDVNGDGVINQKDVSILIKYVVYGKLDIGELTKPSAPIISFVSGEEGENGWYTSNVVLKVTKPENSPIPITDMICSITGTNNQEEQIIRDGENITIELEGIYEINCYSLTQMGVKSTVATRTVKIDKTAPISANLMATLKDGNGAPYQFGTPINQNVYLQTTGGEDNISGIKEVTIEATGATKLPKGTKAPVTIENNGTTNIVVTTKNNAGFTSQKNYTIIIDKVVKDPGTVITKLNDQNGELYEENTWTNQDVYVEVQNGGENITTTYQVEGANTISKTSEPTTLTKEGISTITIINEDDGGNVSKRNITVKIDKQAPQKPVLKVTGKKILEDSSWYTSDVHTKMTAIEKSEYAKIKHIEYQLKEMTYDVTKTDIIQNQETLTITEEGIYELTAWAVDEAGNRSEGTTVEIKLDTTNPVAGTLSMYTNNQDGQVYVNNTWTNQSIYVELVEGTDELSGHSNTVYSVIGAEQRENLKDAITITKEGTYTITVTTTDLSGRSSQRIYTIRIDKQKPEAPTLEVIAGEKVDPRNQWYNSNVTVEVIRGNVDKGGSGMSYTTCQILGSAQIEETVIQDHGTIEIPSDGTYEIIAYNYDAAGNKSEGTIITILLDKTAPQNIQISPTQITGTSFHLQISAEEQLSGIDIYQIYVDGGLYQEIERNEQIVECDVINQLSGLHTISVKIKDIAGNESNAETQVNMGRLQAEDIDYIEFMISNFTQTKDGETVNTGAKYIVSDTSISEASKYIQVVSTESDVIGQVAGKTRLVRKDGQVVEEFEYYPENLLLEIAQYSDGSGSLVEHQAQINVANTILTNEDIEEGTNNNANVNITEKQNSDNIFTVNDKKITGTETYTRFIIRQITWNDEKIPFKITSNVI